MALVFLFYYSLQVSCKKRDISGESKRESHLRRQNSFACFPAILSQQSLSTEVKIFLLPRATEIKDLLIQRTFSRTDLKDKFVLFSFKQHIVNAELRFETMKDFRFVEFLNPNLFHVYKKNSYESFVNFGYT